MVGVVVLVLLSLATSSESIWNCKGKATGGSIEGNVDGGITYNWTITPYNCALAHASQPLLEGEVRKN